MDWLFNQLPVYQRTGGANYKIDLDKTWRLMELLGNPHDAFKSLHVAGTNGKGSTSHMLASVLQEAGYTVGLYTSPHLMDFRERVRINGVEIPQEKVIEYVTTYKNDFTRLQLSFFEMTVGLAFWYFAQSSLDIAIVEVGMGGRLDSTNVLQPELSVITNIGLDHTAFLGNTLEAIATEKGGIIKPNTPVVIGQRHTQTQKVFMELANKNNSPLFWAEENSISLPHCDLKGNYQKQNQKTALTALEVLKKNSSFTVDSHAITRGFAEVCSNTGLRGRWELWGERPTLIADTAHNTEGLLQVSKQLQTMTYDTLHIVWGMVNDKNAKVLMKLLPKNAEWYLSSPSIPRAMKVSKLEEVAQSIPVSHSSYSTLDQALAAAQIAAAPHDLIYVGGSTFVIADLLPEIKKGN